MSTLLAVRQCRAAVYNPYNFHIDVNVALAYYMQEAGCSVDLFQHPTVFGVVDIIQDWFKGFAYLEHPNNLSQRLLDHVADYDVIIFGTYPPILFTDFLGPVWGKVKALPVGRRPRLVLALHLVDDLKANASVVYNKPDFLEAAREAHFLTISPFVASYASQVLQELGVPAASERVEWYAPVLPLNFDSAPYLPGAKNYICVSGVIHPAHWSQSQHRIVQMVAKNSTAWRQHKASLVLLGKIMALLDIPRDLEDMVTIHSGLAYEEYYRALMRCKALLVVLSGGQKMLTQRGSTAISTAVTAQIPLIISDAALAAYGYVSPDVAFQYPQVNGTDELFTGVGRATEEALVAGNMKHKAMAQLKSEIMGDQVLKMGRFIDRVLGS
ncbi:hypothetical protein N2152v2_003831 [Parachlorella kessleri]